MNPVFRALQSSISALFKGRLTGIVLASPLLFSVGLSGSVAAVPECIDDYAIVQLGDNSTVQLNEGVLEISSNSSVFGNILKGKDTSGENLKLSTAKVTGRWDIEIGVDRDASSSYAGSQGMLASSAFEDIATRARAMSAYWSSLGGTATDFSELDGGTGMNLVGSGGVNVFDSTTPFKLTSQTELTLTGGPDDVFVFNIFPNQEFQISGQAKIVLEGITPGQVLFNVLGGNDKADAQIGGSDVLFAGTLLAPGRNVLVSQTHFHTFRSSGFPENVGGSGNGAPATEPVTYAEELAIFKTYGYAGTESQYGAFTTSGAGLFGQIVAGGKVTWSAADLVFEPFCFQPADDEPGPGPITGPDSRVINLSVRAYVGTGSEVLIPGIVISGSETVKMLLRAVGPTLGSLGVEGILEDPRLTVLKDGQPVVSNDDWGANTDRDGLLQTFAAVGAFALDEGSKDSALIAGLDAGMYTIKIEGVGGSTGVCLVEVYWLE